MCVCVCVRVCTCVHVCMLILVNMFDVCHFTQLSSLPSGDAIPFCGKGQYASESGKVRREKPSYIYCMTAWTLPKVCIIPLAYACIGRNIYWNWPLRRMHAKQTRTVLADSIFIIEQSCSYNCSSNNLNCSYNYNSNNLSLITACKSQLVSMWACSYNL